MQREILHGVPYFLKGSELYTWNNAPVRIGTYDDKTKRITFDSLGALGNSLQQWRAEQRPRARKPAQEAS